VDEFDYLPEYEWPSGAAPHGRYPDPQGRLADGRGAPGPPPWEASHGTGNGRGYPPPTSGPMPAYQPPSGRSGPGYPPAGQVPAPPRQPYRDPIRTWRPNVSGPLTAYQPGHSGPRPAYQPDSGGPTRAYRPDATGPWPVYGPPPGEPGPPYQPPEARPTSGYRRVSTALLSEFPVGEPITAYQPPPRRRAPERAMPERAMPEPAMRERSGPEQTASERPGPERTAPERAPEGVRPILGWLPFGNRLVLLPKEPAAGDDGRREHRDSNAGWLRPAVFGAMDGLVTNSSLIAGVGAGGGAHGAIVLTGVAGLIAGAFSMATGEYISVSSQNELTQAEVELERKQHERDPEGKRRRLTQLFVEKGVSPNLAEAVVRQISADPDRAVATHVREELGIDPDDLPSPRTAALASLASFTVGALIPLSPFIVGYPVLQAALAISGAAAFAGGAAVAKLTGRSMLLGGLRQLTAAVLATAAALLIGHVVGGHIS
jgi:vacuolar iron transporter family protein